MSEANQSSGSPSEIAREPEAITFAEFLRGRASAAGVTPPDDLRPAGVAMPQPSPAQVWERRRRRRQFFAWIVTVLLLAALVYGWLWVYGVL